MKFHHVLLGHDNLANYIETDFSMINHHGWDGEYLDNLEPWLRTVNVELLKAHLEKLKEEREKGNR